MSFAQITDTGAIPTLELALRFAAARQRVISHNIANISTPNFIPAELSVENFRQTLGDAIRERQRSGGVGPLKPRSGRELTIHDDGGVTFKPTTPSANVLFHDRNNRDLESLMQGLGENAMAYRTTAELLRSRYEILKTAISQRV